MKIIQISGHDFVPSPVQRTIESSIYSDAEQARVDVQKYFPNHLVCSSPDALRVTLKDKSFYIAEFRRIL